MPNVARRVLLWAVAILGAAGSPLYGVQGESKGDPFKAGLALYRANRLAEALPWFEEAAVADSGNPTMLAWLAETLRRVDKVERAVSVARRALDLAPCHAFAHNVLGAAYNPQYGAWDSANAESTWLHLRRAIDCDPEDGNGWLNIWGEALRRGDTKLEERALRRLRETGFLTRTALAYNRWLLRDLPENAVVLANGDLDTYPALAVQLTERFRRDVVVVNLPMLNLWWYVALVHARYGLPLPRDSASLATRPMCGSGGADTLCLGRLVLTEWRRLVAAGTLRRPLAGLDDDMFPSGPGVFVRSGALAVLRSDGAVTVDTVMLRRSLQGIDGRDFAEFAVSPMDRSPIRVASAAQKGMPLHIVWAAATYGRELRRAHRLAEARALLEWVQRFARDARLDTPDARSLLEEYTRELEAAERAP